MGHHRYTTAQVTPLCGGQQVMQIVLAAVVVVVVNRVTNEQAAGVVGAEEAVQAMLELQEMLDLPVTQVAPQRLLQ